MDISVIIVNYNTEEFIAKCLDSIAAERMDGLEVIIVDNASKDNTVKIIRNYYPWAKLIVNPTNYGFARANNQALHMSRGKYVHFLNPDTEVGPCFYSSVIDFMESHPQYCLAGTRILNPDGSLQSSVEERYPGGRHSLGDLIGLKGTIAWVLGASMVARRDSVLKLGGFDEDFFVYGEDLDLGLRVRKAGWEIGFISEAVVFHWGGQSERESWPIEVWKKKARAEGIFYHKHYSDDAIRVIRRNDAIKALWRIATLKATLHFAKDKARIAEKIAKYRLALDFFRTFWDDIGTTNSL